MNNYYNSLTAKILITTITLLILNVINITTFNINNKYIFTCRFFAALFFWLTATHETHFVFRLLYEYKTSIWIYHSQTESSLCKINNYYKHCIPIGIQYGLFGWNFHMHVGLLT